MLINFTDTAAARVDLQCHDKLLSVNNTLLTNTPLNEALVILQEVCTYIRTYTCMFLYYAIHIPIKSGVW